MNIKTTITYTRSPELLVREFRKVVKATLKDTGTLWHKKFLPWHFKEFAGAKYGYRKRSSSYAKKKLRLRGHRNPLVWSGRMQRELMRRRQLTGTAKAVRVRMTGPPYLKYHNKPRELTAITEKEAQALAQALHDQTTQAIRQLKERRTVEV